MEETSALQTALGLLPPAVVIDSLRYVSARPPPKTTPQDHIHRLIKESREIGAEQFVARLKKPTQVALLSDLVDVEEDEDDVAERLEKELKKDLSSDPSATFKQVNGKVVKACATELMLDPSQDLEELRALLVDEIILTGMETLFTILPRSLLDQYCAHWKLERTGGKAGLVARLLAHLFDLDLDDQVEAAAESDEPESDEMEVEAVAKPKPKKDQVVAVKKAPATTTKKTKATKKTKKMEESDDAASDDDIAPSSEDDEDDEEQEEWERSETKKKKKLDKRPVEGKRPLAEPIANPAAAKAAKTGKKPDLATSRAISPRTPAARPVQKKAPAKKKTLQLPDDMHELNVDMKESMIVRKYKIDQLRQCLKMNGLSEIGLKAALAARLHVYMVDVARQSDEENADPNSMDD